MAHRGGRGRDFADDQDYQFDEEQKGDDGEEEQEYVGLHRRHSLTQSVYVPPEDEEDGHQYEDSDFRKQEAAADPTAQDDPNAIEDAPVELQDTGAADQAAAKALAVEKSNARAAFLTCPWAAAFDRSKPTPIAPQGFIAQPKKANAEQKTMFSLQKSRDLSAQVLELAGRQGSYEQLCNLLLIRDTFEPFAVDINYTDPSNGETPLMAASSAGLLDIVQLLYECSFNWVISYPLDVDRIDFLGTTALMKAAQNGHLIMVKYLLEVLNVRVDLVDYDGWSALMFAASKGHWHIVEYLVQARDADVLASTALQDTPLMLAANNGYLNVVRYLVEHTDAGDKFEHGESTKDRLAREARELEEEENQAERELEQMEQQAAKPDGEGEEGEEEEEDEDGEDNEDEEDENSPNGNGGKKAGMDSLEIMLLRANDLIARDAKASDPYVNILLLAPDGHTRLDKQASRVIDQSLNPVWNQKFSHFPAVALAGLSRIRFEVWDKDMIGKQFLGLAEVRVEELRSTSEFTLILRPWEGKPNAGASRVQGTLSVKIEYFSASYADILRQQAELAFERESGDANGAHRGQHLARLNVTRGLDQQNLKGWTALLGAAHYGQLYVVHYLVSKGADPDVKSTSGHTARDMPLSLLAHNRFGVPVVQPQVLAAIEAGVKERGKVQRNVKRHAVERALVRFKRAERYVIDAKRAQQMGQFETAHLLHSYAVAETRPVKLIREEVELRTQAEHAKQAMGQYHANLLHYRDNFVREMLRKEAGRNLLLAERYIDDKAYPVAMQCLAVCLQYEPTNPEFLEKEAFVKAQQNAKNPMQAAAASAVDVDSPEGGAGKEEDLSPKPRASISEKGKEEDKDQKAPRSCQLFGFSWF